ncbi:STAS domain-containing protein [Paenibacillus sacheonensis]|uniref:Anti-sigma factor antagonist n=1 Tax=Paenibacillus sacheonensis TaxID=742054 RepID=A0A7X4YLI5_9BACL|nr:STAS domain-containing protein [Paenibacillus sacheonensis]MBM7568300.1 anti-anti-sigma factor [Paenibacillus sacheonensis]NBC68515.1 anti-sigma factor antagonist [Paenibacillus sacheonensis]
MNVTVDTQNQIRTVRISGRLDGTTMQELEERFLRLADEGGSRFVFDLSLLDYISSAGLRVMLLAVKKTKAVGGKLALFGLNDNVNEIFRISGFSTIFSLFSAEEEALAFVS